MTGDFNFDLLNTGTHNETFDFFDTMMSNFLLPVITIPTKINRGSNTLIDNIFTNNLNPDTKSGNLEISLSDGHLPSFMITPKQNQNHLPKKHNIYNRNKKHFNNDAFLVDYKNINWDEIIDVNKNDVNFSMESLITNINGLLDVHMPLRKITQKEFKQKYKPWITNAILGKIRDKNKVLKKYLNCKSVNRKAELYDNFKQLKNDITHETRFSKKHTTKNTLQNIKETCKKYGKA